jgi:signal peptidase I
MKKLLLILLALMVFAGCTQSPIEEEMETPQVEEEETLMTYKMYGPSMMPTINEDEILKVKELDSYERGDIVVITSPYDSSERFVKRIIGLPGETVGLIDGLVYVADEKLDELYLDENSLEKTYPGMDRVDSYEVAEDGYFVLGDNRGASTDSRNCFRDSFVGACENADAQNYITNENIIGKVINVE